MTKKLSNYFMILMMCFFASTVNGQNANEPAKEFKPDVAKTWQKAGALVGWLIRSELGQWQYYESIPKDAAALPVFLWQKYKPGQIAKLPAPSVPFAIGLGGTDIDDEGLSELIKLQNLRSLDISHTKFTDSGLGQLAAIKNLTSLDLGASAITDKGLIELSKISSLENVYLGSTAVTDAGTKELVKLKKLQFLYLYNTDVTDATLKTLLGLKNLQSLLLSNTLVTARGMAELGKARPKLRIIL